MWEMEEGGLKLAGGVCILTCSCSAILSYQARNHWSSLATLDQSQMCLDLHLSIRCLNFRLQLGEWMHLKKPLVASPEHSWDYDCTYDAGQLERDHNNEKNNHNNKKRKRAKRRITGVGAAHKRPHCSSRRRSLPPYSHKCSSLLQSSLTWQSKHM